MKFATVLVAILAVTSCEQRPATRTIEFLTRQGCVNTAIMKRNLDEALTRNSRQAAYNVIDLDHLPPTDARKAYPTPTVLQGGTDSSVCRSLILRILSRRDGAIRTEFRPPRKSNWP